MQLGKFGVWGVRQLMQDQDVGEYARFVEALGFRAFWLGGSQQLPALRPLLEATERIVVATGILNVWDSKPGQVARDFAELEEEFPGRVLLGIGIGHPERDTQYATPLATMERFLDALDAATPAVTRERRCLAALGPKMLDLSAERSLGSCPYFVPVEHTRVARARLGAQALLAPELAFVLDDTDAGLAKARAYADSYLGMRNYTQNLLRVGFDNSDLADGGSERLVNAVVPHGNAEQIAAIVREHLDAGASHVCVQPVGVEGIPRAELTALASALGIDEHP